MPVNTGPEAVLETRIGTGYGAVPRYRIPVKIGHYRVILNVNEFSFFGASFSASFCCRSRSIRSASFRSASIRAASRRALLQELSRGQSALLLFVLPRLFRRDTFRFKTLRFLAAFSLLSPLSASRRAFAVSASVISTMSRCASSLSRLFQKTMLTSDEATENASSSFFSRAVSMIAASIALTSSSFAVF
jgi:hypothetical protein